MAALVTLTFAFLIFQVNSQILTLGPSFPISRGCEPAAPCGCETYRPSVPMGIDTCCTLQALPNIVSSPQSILNTLSLSQPCPNVPGISIMNLPAPSCVQNKVLISQPVKNTILPTQPILNNVCVPKCANLQPAPICANPPQLTPSVIGNAVTPPVVTVVDNTLANSLANALQLLIISNLLDSTGTVNLAQNPCINNYEILTPDFSGPSISCDYFSNVPEPVFCCPEPVFSCSEPVFSCPEPVVTCPEPVVFQSYPTNCGGSFSYVDTCAPNQIFLEATTQCAPQCAPTCAPQCAPQCAPTCAPQYVPQCMPQVAPSYVCNEKVVPIPAVTNIPPMALEVPFPAAIPAQLTCNFGFLPTNEPCVTFNVEALPCNNMFSNIFANYI